jgi:hypothetical protein
LDNLANSRPACGLDGFDDPTKTRANRIIRADVPNHRFPTATIVRQGAELALSVGLKEHSNGNDDFRINLMKITIRLGRFGPEVRNKSITASVQLSEKLLFTAEAFRCSEIRI